MRFSMLGVTALTLTGLFGADAEACGRRKAKKQCCPAPVAVSSCCGGGYGHSGHAYSGNGNGADGYAVAPNAWVNPQPMPMTNPAQTTNPATGTVTQADGTTTNTTGGVIQTSGTTVTGVPMQPMPYQGDAMTSYAGAYGSDCGCPSTGNGRRRGLSRR